MALWGSISVNNIKIGEWSAVRQGDIDNENGNVYRCMVDMFPPCRPQDQGVYEFEVRHFYEDGASALASKVLWQATLRRKQDALREGR
jgi:hypothetical protein